MTDVKELNAFILKGLAKMKALLSFHMSATD
jgi:hypothetical protein